MNTDASVSKPIGPIPQQYSQTGGALQIGKIDYRQAIEQSGGAPVFVYDAAAITARMNHLRTAMPSELALHYAFKANPYPPISKLLQEHVDGFDVASGGELRTLIALGINPRTVSFAGPGKSDDELEQAIAAQVTLNCESEAEAERSLAIGARVGIAPRMAIRVNPPFDLRGSGMKMGGGAKPFGVDAERVPALAKLLIEADCEWRGFQIFAGSQSLDAKAIGDAQRQSIELAARLSEKIGAAPAICNIGGGFGIPYFAKDERLDVSSIGTGLAEQLRARPPILAQTRFVLELGRYIVGEAGVYLTRILDRKVSQGETFLVTDGGLHHQLAASGNFGTVVRRNYPVAMAKDIGGQPVEIVNIVGRLCTPLDRLADKVAMPRADVGDVVAIFCAGAYGASASPMQFLGHGPARELLV